LDRIKNLTAHFAFYLNPASVAFAEGKLFSKTQDFRAAFELMRVMQAQLSHNLLMLKA